MKRLYLFLYCAAICAAVEESMPVRPVPTIQFQAAGLSSGYAPVTTTCPGDGVPLVRSAENLSDSETAYIKGRTTKANGALAPWLDLLDETFNTTGELPTIALATGGGGYRGMLLSAGLVQAFDGRSNKSAASSRVSGLYQAITYHAAASGGAWLLASMAGNNWTTVDDLLKNRWQDALTQDILGNTSNAQTSYLQSVVQDLQAKEKAGFEPTLVDAWGRLLSFQLLANVDQRLSDLSQNPLFASQSVPYPIFTASGVYPGDCIPYTDDPQFEMHPFEFGSWDGGIASFMRTDYLGTGVDQNQPSLASCIQNYDNLGFILATSSNLFSENCLAPTLKDLVPGTLNYSDGSGGGSVSNISILPFNWSDSPVTPIDVTLANETVGDNPDWPGTNDTNFTAPMDTNDTFPVITAPNSTSLNNTWLVDDTEFDDSESFDHTSSQDIDSEFTDSETSYPLSPLNGTSIAMPAALTATLAQLHAATYRDSFAAYPNPFQYSQDAPDVYGQGELLLVDPTLSMHGNPIWPFLQPQRAVDVVIVADNADDTANNFPSGQQLHLTYRAALTYGLTKMPAIPSGAKFESLKLNKRPTFFGCNSTDTLTIIYLPNVNYVFDSNQPTSKTQYSANETSGMIANGVRIGQQTSDPNWPRCLGCAFMKKTGTVLPTTCSGCFQTYCYN